jgi:uncharacterized membrane protein (DUF4010 family)
VPWLGALDPVLLRDFAIALLLGALVGVDRERKVVDEPRRFGGLRTFTLVSLSGAISAWLSGVLESPAIVAAALVGLIALLSVGHLREEGPGLTGEVAAIVTFLLGAMCLSGHPETAVVLGITMTLLLAFKGELHDLVKEIDAEDLRAAVKLLFASFVVLPLLPGEAVDPWGAIVPFDLWLLVVLISGLSFAGYVAIKVAGERAGLLLTGIFGGLASSTATTLSLSRHASSAHPDALAAAVVASWAVMAGRVLVLVGVTAPFMVPLAAWPVGALGVGFALATIALWWRGRLDRDGAAVALRNPFSLISAAKFAALFGAVKLAAAITRAHIGDQALLAVAAVAGTTDADAITLTLFQLAAQDPSDAALALQGIALALASNTVVKSGMVAVSGSRALAARTAAAGAFGLALGGVGLAIALRSI